MGSAFHPNLGSIMSLELFDLILRFERVFGVKIRREQITKMVYRNDPPDITVGEMFDLVSKKAFLAGSFDEEMDKGVIWPIFQKEVSDALGVEPHEVTKEKWLAHELGM